MLGFGFVNLVVVLVSQTWMGWVLQVILFVEGHMNWGRRGVELVREMRMMMHLDQVM